MRMGKYEMGRALGEGHFGKVKLARHADTGAAFAIKILDRQRILAMKIDEQVN
jgi:5'-AMP-activated protein kinase catalytic alpha subunit